MGELDEPRWAVISERGCEASSLKHEDALGLLRRLVGQKVHGTCIVTNEAARHLAPARIQAAPPHAETHTKA